MQFRKLPTLALALAALVTGGLGSARAGVVTFWSPDPLQVGMNGSVVSYSPNLTILAIHGFTAGDPFCFDYACTGSFVYWGDLGIGTGLGVVSPDYPETPSEDVAIDGSDALLFLWDDLDKLAGDTRIDLLGNPSSINVALLFDPTSSTTPDFNGSVALSGPKLRLSDIAGTQGKQLGWMALYSDGQRFGVTGIDTPEPACMALFGLLAIGASTLTRRRRQTRP